MANVEIVAHHTLNHSDSHHQRSSIELEENEDNCGDDSGQTFTHSLDTCRTNHTNSRGGEDNSSNRNTNSSTDYGATDRGCKGCKSEEVEQLRRRVKFFFMDPCSKFKARRNIPFKMLLQFFKIIFITVQLMQFGRERNEVVAYFEHNQRTLQHLLLKDWNSGYETMPYPPATGDYALYSAEDLLDYIEFAWAQYYNISHTSLATINMVKERKNGTVVPMRLCNRFNNYDEFHNGSYIVGTGVLFNCTNLIPMERPNPYDIRAFLKEENITIPFQRLFDLTLDFVFTTFHLNLEETHYGPNCYIVNATITFRNQHQGGQVKVDLHTFARERSCSGKIMSPEAKEDEDSLKLRQVALDSFIIIMCVLSSVLCARSLWRAWKLRQLTDKMFHVRFGKRLTFEEHMEFVNLWYILIILNDIFTVIGSGFKIMLETRKASITGYNYDICSLMLGLGALMAWIGCLRYLSFFKKYNILLMTLKAAFPNVLRFSLCVLAMYCGFMLCGWVVLGPYHIKFRHVSTTAENLFSLVNGDDMFVTFSATETDNVVVWYFSRIYLYVFISLFIYCVLSLFIAVIMDAYETHKAYLEKGFPKTELRKFIGECIDPLHSGLYRRRHTENETWDWSLIDCFAACCCRHKVQKEPQEEERSLLSQTI